jgi:DNA-binding GntR family transcriptional regulator
MPQPRFKMSHAVPPPEAVAEALRRNIIERYLAGGTRLKQNDIAKEYRASLGNVSMTLRQAVVEFRLTCKRLQRLELRLRVGVVI